MPYPNDCDLFYQNPLKRHLSSWNCLEQLLPYNRQQLGESQQKVPEPFPQQPPQWTTCLVLLGRAQQHGRPCSLSLAPLARPGTGALTAGAHPQLHRGGGVPGVPTALPVQVYKECTLSLLSIAEHVSFICSNVQGYPGRLCMYL